MKNAWIWIVLAAVLFGAVGFYGGVTYQKAQAPAGFAGRFGGGAGGFGGGAGGSSSAGAGFRNSANIATGTVIAQDSSSITVKSSDGGSKIVFISDQTHVSKQQVLTPADIKVGDQVAAFGEAATGGITATTVQVIPPGGTFSFGGFGRGGGAGGGGGNGGGGNGGGSGTTSGQ